MLSSTFALGITQKMKFGWHGGVDLGTSNGATAKLSVFNDQWEKVGGSEQSQTVITSDKIQNNDNILAAMADFIADIGKKPISSLHGDDKSGKTLVFFTPGQPVAGVMQYLTNLKTAAGQPVEKLDLNQISEMLKKRHSDILLDKNLKIIAMNDMAGGTTAAIAQLAQRYPDKFKPGMDLLYLMAGGGLGVGAASYSDIPPFVPEPYYPTPKKENPVIAFIKNLLSGKKRQTSETPESSSPNNTSGSSLIRLELTEMSLLIQLLRLFVT